MKKISILSLLLAVVCLLSSCTFYSVRPGKMSELVGTYQLTKYEVIPDAGEGDTSSDEERKQDYLSLCKMEAYLIVTDTGYGYYLYRENNGELSYETIRLEYSMDMDDDTKVESLSYTVGFEAKDSRPGAGKEDMGFNSRKHTLAYNVSNTKVHLFGKEIGSDKKVSVVYSRISTDTSTDTAAKKLNVTLPPLPSYDLKSFDGILRYTSDESFEDALPNPYIYYYVDFDNLTLTGTAYYALRDDYNGSIEGLERTKTVTAVLGEPTSADSNRPFTIDGKTFSLPCTPDGYPATYASILHFYDPQTHTLLPDATEGYCFSECLSVVFENEEADLQKMIRNDLEAYQNKMSPK